MAANPQKELTLLPGDGINSMTSRHSGAGLSPSTNTVSGTWTSIDSLSQEVEQLRLTVAQQRDELELMRRQLDNYRRDVDQSVLYLAQMSNDRWNRTNQMMSEIRTRLDRYLNVGPFRFLRALRRKLRRLP